MPINFSQSSVHEICMKRRRWAAFFPLVVAVQFAWPAGNYAASGSDHPILEKSNPVAATRELIGRILPEHVSAFICEEIPQDAGRDVFEIDARDGKIILRGNDGVSLAMALNWYLRYKAKANYDWQAVGPLVLTGPLPMPKAKVRQVCLARERFFFNYCTFGYTFPFTDWAGWQRFMDWMAMNGINRPLLQCGLEAVWHRVWNSYGLTDEQIRAYFTGPAHLPWHRMANIDKWGGPLPMSYIDAQMKLQRQILARARSLGMKPVLSGFAGHVPELLKAVKPEAKITRIRPGWGGFEPAYASFFLSPEDPLFKEIQGRFLKTQAELYGTDHLYAADPFNEITPPSWEPSYQANVAKSIYEGMAAADPDAVWYQMAWLFYFDKRWSKKSSSGETPLYALCKAVPKGKMVLLDYVCEETEIYRSSESFYDSTFLWCYVGNYGGNIYMRAPLKLVSERVERALAVANCRGIGTGLEGTNVNPEMFEMFFEQPWHDQGAVDDAQWIADYAVRRTGFADAAVGQAWQILREKVLNGGPSGHFDRGSAVTSRPPTIDAPKGPPPPKTALADEVHARPPQLQAGLVEAIDALFQASPQARQADGYRYDAVNFVRQALAYHSDDVKARMLDAYKRRHLEDFRREAAKMPGILRDLDELLGTRHEYLLGSWIAAARAWGTTPAEADYFEHEARQIITTWGQAGRGLNNYARREWNGILRAYYLPQWEKWIAMADAALAEGKPFDNRAFTDWCVEFEGNFSNSAAEKFLTDPRGDPLATAKRLFEKYRPEL
jgi:alpha-N-acetylglucosaminidase